MILILGYTAIEADGAYSKIWQTDAEPMLISKNIKFFEKLVENHIQFYRVHRSAIVNINCIQKYSKKEGLLILTNNEITKIARDKKKAFEEYVSSIQ